VSEGQKLVDLGGSAVVDDHCHGFRLEELATLDPAGWEDRLTMMGMCFLSSGQTDERLARQVAALRDGTVFALTARRWLAEYLGVEPSAEAVAAARAVAFSADAHGYVARLMADQGIAAVIADEGYPQPPVARAEFERALGIPVHRVARIEPMVVELQQADMAWADFEAGFEDRLERAAADGHTVGFKSIIAYRTGLDVTDPTASEAAAAYDVWRAAGWPKDRGPGKTVRDHLLRATLRACRRHDKVMHLHCGGGDPDIVLAHARPRDVFGLLHDHMDQPIVLIHGGYPWLAEAAYVASILPFVYIDLSEFLPWASLGIDRELEMLLGVVPAAKLLYGSDEASEPEVFWVAVRMAREALERVLSRSVRHDFLTVTQAEVIGRGVLAENTKRLHGIA
jgi:uncharacterized protein